MRQHIVLFSPRKDGSCVADHIIQTLEQGGENAEWPEEFPLPEVPLELDHIWAWYWQIRQGIPSGINGHEPISHVEMLAWAQMAKVEIGPSTLHYFRILDAEYLKATHKKQKSGAPVTQSRRK